ncbi:MAG: GNAT family N-acetyltransferase [Myxococcota bacterium]
MTRPVEELETQRLRLRAWRDEDLAPFARLNADPVVSRFLPAKLTRAESDALAGRIRFFMAAEGWGLWATELKDTREFIGFIGLSRPNFDAPFTPCVEIGWRLASPYHGRGLASEGARAVASFAFDNLGLSELVAFTAPDNLPSRRVMEKLGMTRDPREDFDHPKLPEGHPLRRHVLYRLRSPVLTQGARRAG